VTNYSKDLVKLVFSLFILPLLMETYRLRVGLKEFHLHL